VQVPHNAMDGKIPENHTILMKKARGNLALRDWLCIN
jgi:hypothetical protein